MSRKPMYQQSEHYQSGDLVRARQTLTPFGYTHFVRAGTAGKVIRRNEAGTVVVCFGMSKLTWICSPLDIEPFKSIS